MFAKGTSKLKKWGLLDVLCREFRSLDSLGINPIQETGISQHRNSAEATRSGKSNPLISPAFRH